MASTRVVGFGLLVYLGASCVVYGESPRVCDLAAKRGGLTGYRVTVEPDKDGYRTLEADVDLDGSSDALRWSGPAPGGRAAADKAVLSATLASSGKSFTLEQQRIDLVKIESRYYAVTTRLDSAIGPWQREVLAIGREGFSSICSLAGKGEAP